MAQTAAMRSLPTHQVAAEMRKIPPFLLLFGGRSDVHSNICMRPDGSGGLGCLKRRQGQASNLSFHIEGETITESQGCVSLTVPVLGEVITPL
jgi:hypothetical protein